MASPLRASSNAASAFCVDSGASVFIRSIAGAGGNGGSGVVIIAYSNTLPAATITGGGTQTNVGGNFNYTFTSSGTITF